MRKFVFFLFCCFLFNCGKVKETKSVENLIKFNDKCFKSLRFSEFESLSLGKSIYFKTSESTCSQCIDTELDIILKIRDDYKESFFIITSNQTGVNDLYYQYLFKYKIPVFEACCSNQEFNVNHCQIGCLIDSVLYPIITFSSSEFDDVLMDRITYKVDSLMVQE